MKHVPFVLINYGNVYNISFHRSSLYPKNNEEITFKYFLNQKKDILHTSTLAYEQENNINKYLITNNFNIYKNNNIDNIRFIPMFFKTHIRYKQDILDIIEIDNNFSATLNKNWINDSDILLVSNDLKKDVFLNISRHPDPFYTNYKNQHVEQNHEYKLYIDKLNSKKQASNLLKLYSPNLNIDTVWIVSMIDTPNTNSDMYHSWLKKDIDIDKFMTNLSMLYNADIIEYENIKMMKYNINNDYYIKNWNMYYLSLKLIDTIEINYFKECNTFNDAIQKINILKNE